MRPPRPVAEFGDPQASSRRLCAALPRPERLGGVDIRTRLPEARPASPLLVVRAGSWPRYQPPVYAENRVRFTSWASDEDRVWDVASWYHAQLLAFRDELGTGEIRRFLYDGGPERGIDPDYKIPIVGFTLRAVMRPRLTDAVDTASS